MHAATKDPTIDPDHALTGDLVPHGLIAVAFLATPGVAARFRRAILVR
jgi:hypothetical protein